MIAGVDQGRHTQTERAPFQRMDDEADSDQNAIALERTGRDYISYSSISTYQRCPLRYYFSYIAGLAPEFVSSSLIFGGATGRRGTLRWRQPRHR